MTETFEMPHVHVARADERTWVLTPPAWIYSRVWRDHMWSDDPRLNPACGLAPEPASDRSFWDRPTHAEVLARERTEVGA